MGDMEADSYGGNLPITYKQPGINLLIVCSSVKGKRGWRRREDNGARGKGEKGWGVR